MENVQKIIIFAKEKNIPGQQKEIDVYVNLKIDQ